MLRKVDMIPIMVQVHMLQKVLRIPYLHDTQDSDSDWESSLVYTPSQGLPHSGGYFSVCFDCTSYIHLQLNQVLCISIFHRHRLFLTLRDTKYLLYMNMFIMGNLDFCLHYYSALYEACKYSNALKPEGRISLIVHYRISLSSICSLIWRHWT